MSQIRDLFATELSRIDRAYEDMKLRLYGSPNAINEVCHYVLSTDGKKVRPLLCLLACSSYSDNSDLALPPAIALEFIHTYSLVHDDLPAMDDDALRRGRPTAHVQFDEARAILAGDALLADAFRLLTDPQLWPFKIETQHLYRQVLALARSAGSAGMVLGQAMDLEHEQRAPQDTTLATLESIHRHKTGELMGAALALGLIAAGQDQDLVDQYYACGVELGLIFQLIDDLIDDLPGTGKTRGKDASTGKVTYLSFYDRDECARLAIDKTDKLIEQVSRLGGSEKLTSLMRLLCARRS